MRLPAALVGIVLLAAGCFTTTTDFREDAEDFIVSNEQIRASLGVTFESAECAEPVNRDVGSEFSCTAIDDNGETWVFSAEIVDGDEYVLNVDRAP